MNLYFHFCGIKWPGVVLVLFCLFFFFLTSYLSSRAVVPFHVFTRDWGCLRPHQHLVLSLLLILAILVGVWWCLVWFLICISPMTQMLNIFLCASWPSVYSVWWTVCSCPLSIVWLDYSYFYCWVLGVLSSNYKSFARYVVCKYCSWSVVFLFIFFTWVPRVQSF